MDYKDTVKIMLNQGLILINRKLKIVRRFFFSFNFLKLTATTLGCNFTLLLLLFYLLLLLLVAVSVEKFH